MLDLSTGPRRAIEAMVAHLTRDNGAWPLKTEEPVLRLLNTFVAFRENDRAKLQEIAGWDKKRRYHVDPLAERIADTWAAYLWGEDPRFIAGGKGAVDQAMLDELLALDPTGGGSLLLASELERAAGMSVSEGEVWSRIYVDRTVAPRPLLEWHSRRSIVPLWIGPRLVAAALWTELAPLPDDVKAKRDVVWRAVEAHAPGIVVNLLFQGTSQKIGKRVSLEAHPLTVALTEEWVHGLPGMLLERIPNRLRGNPKLGVSDYAGIQDFLLDLNEAATIGAVNMRLTARKRAVISSAAAAANTTGRRNDDLDNTAVGQRPPRAKFDADEEFFIDDPLDDALGSGGRDPFRIMEYSFDAESLIAWKQNLVETALTRVALSGQYVGTGEQNAGYAISGTALRLRLIATDQGGKGKARYWEDGLPRIVGNMQRIDAMDEAAGGFGRQWTDPSLTPILQRRPGIPVDGLEEAQRHQALVAAGLESVETGVRELHPDWGEERIKAEVELIRADRAAMTPGAIGSFLGV